MSAKSYSRGHEIVYVDNKWVYIDSGEQIDNVRPCARCGNPPTSEGHDACLGHIEGAIGACCGHGKEVKYVIYGD